MRLLKKSPVAALMVSMAACLLLASTGCRATKPVAEKKVDAVTKPTTYVRPEPKPIPTDWKLSVQAYTYRMFTFMDAVDACAGMGIKYIEAYPGQEIGGTLAGKLDHTMPKEVASRLLAELARRHVILVAYGVVNGNGATEWRQIFSFAKTMGIGTICTEPKQEDLDIVCALADEFGINVALHNHAEPSRYWDPATVLAACEGRTERIGACVDNGHWARSGLRGEEAVRLLKGRIRWFHLKDIDAPAKYGHCVPFGAGSAAVNDLLAAVRKQGYKGFFSIEYESDPGNPSPAVEACAKYFFEARKLRSSELQLDSTLPDGMVRDIAGTWASLDMDVSGKWEEFNAPDMSGYVDATDGVDGKITASGEGFSKEHFPNAFDNTDAKWCIKTPTIWIEYAFPERMMPKVIAYTIMSANDCPQRDPKDWQLLGSGDGTSWTVIDERKGQTFFARHFVKLFKIAKPGKYRFYKLDVTKNSGAEESQLSEIELLVERPEDR